jgi:hypothetical protein
MNLRWDWLQTRISKTEKLLCWFIARLFNSQFPQPTNSESRSRRPFHQSFPLSITHRWKTEKLEIGYDSLPLTKISERLKYATISTSKISS